MNNEPVVWNYNGNNLKPNTITFNSVNSDWVMQITADRKIIVNEDVEVSKAARAVLDAVQNLLLVSHPVKELTDEEIMDIGREMFESPRWPSTAIEFARAILRKTQESDKIESLGTVNIGGVHFRNGKEVK